MHIGSTVIFVRSNTKYTPFLNQSSMPTVISFSWQYFQERSTHFIFTVNIGISDKHIFSTFIFPSHFLPHFHRPFTSKYLLFKAAIQLWYSPNYDSLSSSFHISITLPPILVFASSFEFWHCEPFRFTLELPYPPLPCWPRESNIFWTLLTHCEDLLNFVITKYSAVPNSKRRTQIIFARIDRVQVDCATIYPENHTNRLTDLLAGLCSMEITLWTNRELDVGWLAMICIQPPNSKITRGSNGSWSYHSKTQC